MIADNGMGHYRSRYESFLGANDALTPDGAVQQTSYASFLETSEDVAILKSQYGTLRTKTMVRRLKTLGIQNTVVNAPTSPRRVVPHGYRPR